MSWIYSVLFYAGTLVLVHVMTATRRTADARFPLLMLFTLNALVERLICNLRSVRYLAPKLFKFCLNPHFRLFFYTNWNSNVLKSSESLSFEAKILEFFENDFSENFAIFYFIKVPKFCCKIVEFYSEKIGH